MVQIKDIISISENQTKIIAINVFGRTIERTLKISKEEFLEGYGLYQKGELIQNAFPNLSGDDREFLLTGIVENWDELFDEEEE